MKRCMLIFLLCLCNLAHTEEWTDYLILASQSNQLKSYELAIYHINQALSLAPQTEIPNLYIQKAIYAKTNNDYSYSIFLLNELENSYELSLQQKIDCLEIKIVCYSHLDDLENAQKCFHILKEIDPRFPKFNSSKNNLVITNYKHISNHEKLFKCLFLHLEIAEKSSDIQFFDSGVCVVKKMHSCNCKNPTSSFVDKLPLNCEPIW